jgi:hypothetical protein
MYESVSKIVLTTFDFISDYKKDVLKRPVNFHLILIMALIQRSVPACGSN